MIEPMLLTRPQVEKLTQISRSSIYAHMKNGQFPEPIKIGPGAVRWYKDEVLNWIKTRPRYKYCPKATGEASA